MYPVSVHPEPTPGFELSGNPQVCCSTSSVLGNDGSGQKTPSLTEVEASCCYGCRLILHDLVSIECFEYLEKSFLSSSWF